MPGLDHGGDGLAPLRIAQPHNQRVVDGIVKFKGLFDLFWKDLLACSINTIATAAQQGQGAICFNLDPIPRDRIALPLDDFERLLGLLCICNSPVAGCL